MNLILLIFILLQHTYSQNLIVQVHHRLLNKCFEGLSEWIIFQMQDSFAHGQIQQKLRTGAVQASNVRTNFIALKSASLEHRSDGHYVEIRGFSLKLQGNWSYKVLYVVSDSGPFALDVDDMNVTIGAIVPEVFSGLPFINTDLGCSLSYGSFPFAIGRAERLSSLVSAFMRRILRSELERAICDEVTKAFDAFLRNGVDSLFLQHSLKTDAILNNLLSSKPVLSYEGDLTTYHYGIVQNDSIPSDQLVLLEHYPYDVTYLIWPQLVDEILSTIHQEAIFNKLLTDDSAQYNMSVVCINNPKIILRNESINLVIENYFIVIDNANDSTIFNGTFTISLLLRILYSHRPQLFFNVLRSSSLNFLPENLLEAFDRQLRHHWSSVVSTYLTVPLPSAVNILAKNATSTVRNPFIVFGVDV